MKSLAILGASGHGKVVADIAEQCGYSDIFFFDDFQQGNIEHWNIVGDTVKLLNQCKLYDAVFVGIGNNKIREEKTVALINTGCYICTLIHPSATVSKHTVIGAGSLLCANAVINPFTTIGLGAIINTGATIDHDCQLNDFVHISPGAHLAGNVQVGSHTWIGIGASVIQQVIIGNNVIIGAGAAVINDIPDAVTAVGTPATIIK